MTSIRIFDKIEHQIDPKIYGHFIEELGECIHGRKWGQTR